jgi:multisubunit Na+/H+ antiporter MnhB subunit
MAITASDLLDNIAYTISPVLMGRELDMSSHFLQDFRAIAGRRNIYTWMLIPAVFLGAPDLGFRLVAVWAGATALLHVAHLAAQSLCASPVPSAERPVLEVGQIPPDR